MATCTTQQALYPLFTAVSLKISYGPRNSTKSNFSCPFLAMRCLACNYSIPHGTKFNNARKTAAASSYKGVKIVRHYLRCPNCTAQIVVETHPLSTEYKVVSGAMRGVEERSALREDREDSPIASATTGKWSVGTFTPSRDTEDKETAQAALSAGKRSASDSGSEVEITRGTKRVRRDFGDKVGMARLVRG